MMQLKPPPGHFVDREMPVLCGDSASSGPPRPSSLLDVYLEPSQDHLLSALGNKPYVLQDVRPALHPGFSFGGGG